MLPRKTTLTSVSLVLLATAANAWNFVIYGDSECESSVKAEYRGTRNLAGIYPLSRRRSREHDG